MDFRKRVGDDRFSDVAVRRPAGRPGQDTGRGYERLGLDFTAAARAVSRNGPTGTSLAPVGTHAMTLPTYGLTPEQVRERFHRLPCARTTRRHDRVTQTTPSQRREEARPGSACAPRNPGCRSQIVRETGSPGSQRRCGARTCRAEHPAPSTAISTRRTNWSSAVFLDMARVEMRRLRRKDGRRRRRRRSGSRRGSTRDWTWPSTRRSVRSPSCRWRRRSQMFASPELVRPAYAAMLEPLIEQLQRGPR